MDHIQNKARKQKENFLNNLTSSYSNLDQVKKGEDYDQKFMEIYRKYKNKYDVDSVEEMTDEQKKEFFSQVDAEHTADYEKTKKSKQVDIIKSEFEVNEVYEKEAVDQFLEDFKKSVEGQEDANERIQEQKDEISKLTKVEKNGYTFFINK